MSASTTLPGSALPDRVGVYGGGRMGAGIAHAFLEKAAQVTVIESTDETAAVAREQIARSLERAQERGQLGESTGDAIARLEVSPDPNLLAECELIVEAVPEDLELKIGILTAVERIAPDAVIATNTSALSIDAIAARLRRPQSFLGMHFFNPVPASALVEIVRGSGTGEAVVGSAKAWVEALDKTAIVVADSPGFASSRLGVMLALEAMRMVEAGIATAADIDTAMVLGYRHPVGPLRTTDIVGLDVRLAIAEHLRAELGERFAPPQILTDLVAAGRLGRKSGQGFYAWP